MRRIYSIYLILTCFSMLLITFNSMNTMPIETQYHATEQNIDEILQAETVEEPLVTRLEEELYVNEKNYITDNGKNLILGTVISRQNETDMVEIPISYRNELYYIERTMSPGEEWTYIKINGILIVPKSAGILNQYKTSYYPKSDQLVIHILPDGLSELEVYTDDIPSLVLSETPVRWSYNNGILDIKMSEKFTGEISVFFGYIPLSGTVFIEDTKNLETLEYSTVKMRNSISEMENQVEEFEAEITDLENEIDAIEDETDDVSTSNSELEEDVEGLNKTATDLENSITANVAVSPIEVSIGILLTIILALIILYSIMFNKRSAKK